MSTTPLPDVGVVVDAQRHEQQEQQQEQQQQQQQEQQQQQQQQPQPQPAPPALSTLLLSDALLGGVEPTLASLEHRLDEVQRSQHAMLALLAAERAQGASLATIERLYVVLNQLEPYAAKLRDTRALMRACAERAARCRERAQRLESARRVEQGDDDDD